MTRKRALEDIDFPTDHLDTTNWHEVNINSLSDDDLKIFRNRKLAIDLYLKNETLKTIKELTSIDRKELGIHLKKCLQEEKNGVLLGYRALIPYKRTKNYKRKDLPKLTPNSTGRGQTGAFELLLEAYPNLKNLLFDLMYKRSKNQTSEKIMSKKYIHKNFIKQCEKEGLQSPKDYPFTSNDYGQRSLYRYLNKLEKEHFSKTAKRYGDDSEMVSNKTSSLDDNYPTMIRPFERVQFDGHKIDLSLVLTFQAPDGTERTANLQRIWILTVMDVSTTSVIGYYLCPNPEYNSTDVLLTFKNSIEPQEPKTLTIPGLNYPANSGLPSQVIEETKWALWDELYFDNARANIAKNVTNKLKKIVQCHINTGPTYAPLKRGIVERFYRTLEENGYHRLPSTTGSHSKDPIRNNPELEARKHKISFEEIEELTAVLIADYNTTRTEGNYFASPLESMRQKIEKNPHSIRTLEPELRDDLQFLTLEVTRTIKGNIKEGRRPHINYENVKYTNDLLLRSGDLLGKKLTLVVNIEDLRFVKAYLPDGAEVGILEAAGYWGKVTHSLKIRKEIYKLKNQRIIEFTSKEDPVLKYQSYLQEKAINHKSYRNKMLSVEKAINQTIENDHVKSKKTDVNTTLEDSNSKNIKSLIDKKEKRNMKPTKKIKKTLNY